MTIEEFKKRIVRENWYHKYLYYFLSIAVIFVGFLFIYDRLDNPYKYKAHNTQFYIFLASFLFIFLGLYAFLKIPNRYKVLYFACTLPGEKKKNIISKILEKYGHIFSDNNKQIWSFEIKKQWSNRYIVFISFDDNYLFVSAMLNPFGQRGFIDFGGTEKIRKELSVVINRIME